MSLSAPAREWGDAPQGALDLCRRARDREALKGWQAGRPEPLCFSVVFRILSPFVLWKSRSASNWNSQTHLPSQKQRVWFHSPKGGWIQDSQIQQNRKPRLSGSSRTTKSPGHVPLLEQQQRLATREGSMHRGVGSRRRHLPHRLISLLRRPARPGVGAGGDPMQYSPDSSWEQGRLQSKRTSPGKPHRGTLKETPVE